MLNEEILSVLKNIHKENPQIFSNPKQLTAMLKDLTMNNNAYNATIRWLAISISDFNAFSMIEADFKNNMDFARYSLVNNLISEGASEIIAKEVIGYWATLVGFPYEITPDEISDNEYSFHQLEQMANDGNPSAQCAMGDYYNKIDDNTDFHKAFTWYKKSAEQDFARAQWNLGNFYAVGQAVVTQDFTKSLYWLEKAANQGYVDAMLHAGQASVMNDDYQKAMYWLEMAHKSGHTEAKMHLEQVKLLRNA